MSAPDTEPVAIRVRFDADNIWVDLADGRRLGVPLAYYPRLLDATPQEREQCEVSGGGTGLHWGALDEDISVAGLLAGRPSGECAESLKRWRDGRRAGGKTSV